MKILCIIKTTQYEQYKKNWKNIPSDRQQYLLQEYERHSQFVKHLKRRLDELKFDVTYTRQCTALSGYDVIITCGGDGTFLKAAHHSRNNLLLGLNSNYHHNPKQGSIGALTSINSTNLNKNLLRLKEGKFKITEIKRLSAKINGKKINHLALNDIFIGNKKTYKSSDLIVGCGQNIERFSCSGIIIATSTGSTAWYRNAGGNAFNKNRFGFIVREPNFDRKPAFKQGTLPENKELFIRVNNDSNVISFDSQDKVKTIQPMDEIKISIDNQKPLKIITF